jgi:hypothetical protein
MLVFETSEFCQIHTHRLISLSVSCFECSEGEYHGMEVALQDGVWERRGAKNRRTWQRLWSVGRGGILTGKMASVIYTGIEESDSKEFRSI